MKIISAVLLFFASFSLSAQETIFSENFGISNSISVSIYSGYQNNSNIFSGTSSVTNNTISTGYAGASGNSNVLFNSGQTLIISGIDTYCYLFAFLSLGIWKNSTVSNGSDFFIEYSDNGGNWTKLEFLLPTGAGSAIWRNLTLSEFLPLSTNLSLRFRHSGGSTRYRIDDINVAGIPNSTNDIITNCIGFYYNDTLYNKVDTTYTFYEKDSRGCDSIVNIEFVFDENNPACYLPIELVYFSGKNTQDGNKLSWETLSEYNSNFFEIEKLKNNSWETIGKVLAAGYSTIPISYSFIDPEIVGDNYYRLKLVDFDSFYYSEIIEIILNPIIMYNMLGQRIDILETNNIYIMYSNDKYKLIIIY